MADLRQIADVIRASSLNVADKSEVALGRQFLKHLSMYGKMDGNHVKPVATRGTIYLYNEAAGTWEEMKQDDALSLLQCYDGIEFDDDGKFAGTLAMRPAKCKNIHEAATLDLDHRDSEFFNAQPAGVAFKNGFVTVGADGIELHPRDPGHRATHCLPFDFNPEAECPEWNGVLRRVFARSASPGDDAMLLQEFAGACLTGRAWQYAKCLILSGGGNNGKSVVVETITEQLFPPSSVTYTSPQSWARPEFLSCLRDAKLNVACEMPDSDIQAGDVFKAVIDGGAVMARNLYENPYSFVPRAGHIFLANTLPGNRDNSEGFWRRVLVLGFGRNFSKDPDESGRLRTKEEVKQSLQAELPGIALWALHGARRLLRQGGYTVPTSHRVAVEEWRCDVDQVAAFLSECCLIDGATTHHSEIYRAFREWCESTGRQVVGNRKLANRLRMLGVESGTDRNGLYFGLTVMLKASWGIGNGLKASGV